MERPAGGLAHPGQYQQQRRFAGPTSPILPSLGTLTETPLNTSTAPKD
ncbi:MAG: hypothetical protein P8183_12415 [Anaerolineae bacterium]